MRLKKIKFSFFSFFFSALTFSNKILMSTFWTFNNFVFVWLATGAGPGTFTNVMATEVYLRAFIDGKMGYSSALGIIMASIMTFFGIIYLRLIIKRNLKEIF